MKKFIAFVLMKKIPLRNSDGKAAPWKEQSWLFNCRYTVLSYWFYSGGAQCKSFWFSIATTDFECLAKRVYKFPMLDTRKDLNFLPIFKQSSPRHVFYRLLTHWRNQNWKEFFTFSCILWKENLFLGFSLFNISTSTYCEKPIGANECFSHKRGRGTNLLVKEI